MEIKVVKQIMEWNEDCSNEIKDELKGKSLFDECDGISWSRKNKFNCKAH